MTPGTAQLEPVAGRSRWSWLQSAAEMAALYSGAWSDPELPLAPAGGFAGSPPRLATAPPSAPRLATRSPAPTVRSLAGARSFTLATMDRWGAAGCADDVAAVVSELLANALRHALPRADNGTRAGTGAAGARSRPIRLGLLDLEPLVLCAVADPSAQPPVHRQPDWLEESGRGLHVVASLSSHWGFCVAPDMRGKVVWATVSRDQPQQSPQRLSTARAAQLTPAGAAARSAGRAPTSRPRRSPPRQPSAPDPASRRAWSAAAASGLSARPALTAG
jgi:hypothetical protein